MHFRENLSSEISLLPQFSFPQINQHKMFIKVI